MKYIEGDSQRGRKGVGAGDRPFKTDWLIAVIVLILAMFIALGINSFFYGFELTQLPFGKGSGSGERTGSQAFQTNEARLSGISAQSSQQASGGPFETAHAGEWYLTLVDSRHPVPEDWKAEMTALQNGCPVDSRICTQLQAMFDRMRAEGLSPVVSDGYHSGEEHRKIYEAAAAVHMNAGAGREQAELLAEQEVVLPGCSEHELGIGVDIISGSEENGSQEAVLSWLEEHSWEYGFIRRYPPEKVSVTGVAGEQSHFRYVGTEAARIMFEKGLTLEEYLEAVQ